MRVGVWGVGTWGEKHARIYHELPGAELAGVYDRDEDRARATASRWGTTAFGSAEALLAACEAVSVAVPTAAHRAAVEQACAAGRHVLVEKPMAATLEDADAMIRAARRAGVQLQVGHVERFNPALVAVRPHVSEPKFIEAHRLAVFQPRSLDVDVVFDLMIHDIDAVLDLVGASPAQISAVGVAVLSDNEDIANARLEFADGCVANLTASRVSQDRLRRIRFFQRDAYLAVDLAARSGEVLRVDPARMRPEAPLAALTRVALDVPQGEPLGLELAAFLRSLHDGGPGAAPAEAGRAALAVAEAVRDAMKRRARQWMSRTSAAS